MTVKPCTWISAVTMAAILLLTGCGTGPFGSLFMQAPSGEELLSRIPEMDPSSYNRFLFSMDITAGNADGNVSGVSMSGAVELYGDVSHMYNLEISLLDREQPVNAETWADFGSGIRYTDLGEGFVMDTVENMDAISGLVSAINGRNGDMLYTLTKTTCTVSWVFPTDSMALFGRMLESHTDDMDLEGSGRVTAVFDPETYEFRYFTFVVSTSNKERAGALLDAVFYWDVADSMTDMLTMPMDVFSEAYGIATGISTDTAYDPEVNPAAEKLMESYGGTVEITGHGDGTALFWTGTDGNGIPAAINYMLTDDPSSRYQESRSFLLQVCGDPVEEMENTSYFYDPSIPELTMLSMGDRWYGEIIVTGNPGDTQGDLRKPLITYKSMLGI